MSVKTYAMVPAGWWRYSRSCTRFRLSTSDFWPQGTHFGWSQSMLAWRTTVKDQSVMPDTVVLSECELVLLFSAFSFSGPFDSFPHQGKLSNSLPFSTNQISPDLSWYILFELLLLPKEWLANLMCISL